MSNAVEIEIIKALGTSLPIIAVGFFTAYFAYKAAQSAKSSALNSAETLKVAKQTEINTNSMKDELVALTRKSAHAEGVLEGRADVKTGPGTEPGTGPGDLPQG
jgi:uncharacterized sodium:solute symporter family permease YidK